MQCVQLCNSFVYNFLSIQLLNELLYPFHLTYSLCPFLLITFSILNTFCFVFCNSFSEKDPTISSPFRSLTTYVHGTLFLILLITNTSSHQFEVYPLAKTLLCFGILT